MTNLWSSLLNNSYQAAQHKHIFFVSVKALYIKKNYRKFIAISNLFMKLLNDCQKKLDTLMPFN